MTPFEPGSVMTPGGRVSYAEMGRGHPLVVLHSLLTDARAFDGVSDRLPGRVITLDLPGFGRTEPTEPRIEAFADLMAAAVAEICASEPATLLGNGLGAFVALGMAVRHPELVGRQALVGCGVTFPEPARPAFGNMIELVETGGIATVTPVALRRIYTEDYIQEHPEAAQERADVLARTEPAAFVTACRALQDVDFTGSISGVTMPTLLVVGERDQATPPDMAARLDELLPDSRMVTLPGVAHAPHLQDPGGFIEAVESFLEGE